jgi:hypothetical protein
MDPITTKGMSGNGLKRLIIIQPKGEIKVREIAKLPPFEELRPILGGGWIEHVNVLFGGRHCHMFVDDEGVLKRLPFNGRATRVYWNATLSRHEPGLVYDDLNADWHIQFDIDLHPNVQHFITTASGIAGVAILWEGDFE